MTTFEIEGLTLVDAPDAREAADEVITHDVYGLRTISNPTEWTFIDLGALYGETSLFAWKLGMSVLAYEASLKSFEVMRTNFDRNNARVVAHWAAVVGEAKEPRVGFVHLANHPGGSHVNELWRDTVPAISIKEVVEHQSRIAMKIDIEGAEVDLFVRHTDWLASVDYLAMEFHNHDGDMFEAICRQYGFKVTLSGTGPSRRPVWDRSMTAGILIARK